MSRNNKNNNIQQPQSEKVKVTEGEQILRILSSRVERAVRAATPANDVNNDETATATATTTTTTTTMMPTVQLSLKDLCQDCARVCEGHGNSHGEGARFSQLSAQLEEEENVPGRQTISSSSTTPVQIFEQIVRSVVQNYASKPPESLPGKKIFCVTSARCR